MRVMYQAVSPVTHKSVCSCGCSADLSSDHKNVVIDVQTFEGEADCGSLNGAKCTKGGWTGKLVACTKESVPVGREAVQEDRPLVMG